MREGSGCPRCGGRVVRRGRHGPWPTYCSVRCRRRTEYEVARLRRALVRLDADLLRRLDVDRASGGLYSAVQCIGGPTFPEENAAIRAEVRAIRRLLLALVVHADHHEQRSPTRRPRAGHGAHEPGTHGGAR